MTKYENEKIDVIANELCSLVKRIDPKIVALTAETRKYVNEEYVSHVIVIYDNHRLRVNVECDSISAIAFDVIKAII